jgi:hypothetical protein
MLVMCHRHKDNLGFRFKESAKMNSAKLLVTSVANNNIFGEEFRDEQCFLDLLVALIL